MAQTFKNALLVLGVQVQTVYVCPAETTAIVIGCQAANVGNTSRTLVGELADASAFAQVTLANNVEIPVGASFEPIGGKLVLEAGDMLRFSSSVNAGIHVTVSVLELS